jgi:hypothetical protein
MPTKPPRAIQILAVVLGSIGGIIWIVLAIINSDWIAESVLFWTVVALFAGICFLGPFLLVYAIWFVVFGFQNKRSPK